MTAVPQAEVAMVWESNTQLRMTSLEEAVRGLKETLTMREKRMAYQVRDSRQTQLARR